MKILFDSEKNWVCANACDRIGIEDPETLASCLWDTFVDDMRTIKIVRMKIETTPQDIEFPKDKEYQNLSVGDRAEILIERDFFTAEPRKTVFIKKAVREEYSLDYLCRFHDSVTRDNNEREKDE